MKTLLNVCILFPLLSSCANAAAAVSPTVTIPPNIIIPTPASCTSIVTAPTPGADVPSVFPSVTTQDHVQGAENPVFTITDYIDYQDPRSALFSQAVRRLLEAHPSEVRVVTRTFPLDDYAYRTLDETGPASVTAAQASA